MEPRVPKFQWGEQVQASFDLYNDGSYPDSPPDALLVRTGDKGEIVQVGTHVESDLPVYLVAFGEDRVVGCFEEEITRL